MAFIKFSEFLTESKLKDGDYYIVEMPSKANDFKASKVAGPFKSYDAAVKGGPKGEPYGINQDKVIVVAKDGILYMPHHATKEATGNRLGNILGARHANIEKKMFESELKVGDMVTIKDKMYDSIGKKYAGKSGKITSIDDDVYMVRIGRKDVEFRKGDFK